MIDIELVEKRPPRSKTAELAASKPACSFAGLARAPGACGQSSPLLVALSRRHLVAGRSAAAGLALITRHQPSNIRPNRHRLST